MEKNVKLILDELKKFQESTAEAIDNHKNHIKWCEENFVKDPNEIAYLVICKKILELLELEQKLTDRMILLNWESDFEFSAQQFSILKDSLINTIQAKNVYIQMGNDLNSRFGERV